MLGPNSFYPCVVAAGQRRDGDLTAGLDFGLGEMTNG